MRDRGHAGGPRGFGFVGIVVCVGLAVSLGPACRPAGEGPADKAAARASEAGSGAIAPFPLEEATIVSLQQMMAAGDETSESIVRLYLERIEAIDRTDGTARGSTRSSRSIPTPWPSPASSTGSARRKGREGRCTASRS